MVPPKHVGLGANHVIPPRPTTTVRPKRTLASRLRPWLTSKVNSTYNNTHPPKSPAQARNYCVQYEFFFDLEKTLNLVLMGSFCVQKLVRPHETSVQQYHTHARNFKPITMIFRPELGPGPIILCARGAGICRVRKRPTASRPSRRRK
jgi:hypothetical protein